MGKRPELDLEGDKRDNFTLWKVQFDAYCLTEGYRNPAKDPTKPAEHDDHYIEAKRPLEIALLKQCLPKPVLKTLTLTIIPKLSAQEKVKPGTLMEKLEKQVVGVDTTMANRFIYWRKTKQESNQSMTEWEETIIQTVARCDYKANEDEHKRDKFTFDLNDKYERLRQEIFWKEQNTEAKLTFDQVVAHAKSYEAAEGANNLLAEKQTEEQVNWTRNSGCTYCGGKEHPRYDCPASGQTCNSCEGIGHFSKVCLNKNSQYERGRGRPRGRGHYRGRGVQNRGRGGRGRGQQQQNYNFRAQQNYPTHTRQHHQNQQTQAQEQVHLMTEPEYYTYDDDYSDQTWRDDTQWEPEEAFTLSEPKPGNKYFANLQLSSTGNDTFRPIQCQIDTAATCNTMPAQLLSKLHTPTKMMKSTTKLIPYGGEPITPLGKVQLVCNRRNQYHLLEFQVTPLGNKPALLCGND